jgi:hypothetical protein
MAESAVLTMAYTAAGLSPDGSSSYFLPRLVGLRRAQELMITNRRVSAAEALAWGLVTQVVPDAELASTAAALARKLAAGPTRAFGTVKSLLTSAFSETLETQMELESRGIAANANGTDGREGIAAFLAKRAPKFSGRYGRGAQRAVLEHIHRPRERGCERLIGSRRAAWVPLQLGDAPIARRTPPCERGVEGAGGLVVEEHLA